MLTSNSIQVLVAVVVVLVNLIDITEGQSNYASQANNVEYQGQGLPEEATLDGKVTKLDDLSPIIFLNRTKATLNCGAGSMQVDLKFNEAFFGIAYANFDRNSACQVIGKGDHSYRLELPLKGCGTKQDPQRVFTNNIVVRFHHSLEMDGDEIITIVCRYPPPVATIPAALPAAIINAPPVPVIDPPLKGIQILLIICAIMFLTLLLLGLGVSYYCLRRRPIPIVRRLPMSMGSGSEITKMSDSSVGNISAFEGLKIPRPHPPLLATHSSSGSEPIVSDTIPSDYPSESHSETEEIDTRSLPVSSAGSFENRGFTQETSSIYSENYGQTHEFHAANAMAQASMVPRHPIAVKEQSPKFDVQVRVKRAPPPPPSPLTSDTESVATSRHERNNLSTIMETHEDRESVVTMDSLPQDVAHSQFTYIPELHAAPKHVQPSPVFTKIYRKQQEIRQQRQAWPDDLADGPPISDSRSFVSHGTEMTDTHSVSEMLDTSHLYPSRYESTIQIEQTLPEPPIVVKKPQISSHTVDDVFLRTITEKKTIEDIESHKRRVTEYKAKPIIDPTWDVTIRNYRTEDQNQHQWENFSDISSASGLTLTPKMERSSLSLPPTQYINESGEQLTSPQLVVNMKPIEIPPEDKAVPNWDVLIRVLEDPDMPEPDEVSSIHSSVHPLTRQLSYEDKAKWKEIITTESSLRTMLTEAVVREDFERIRNDIRYERIFEPQAWDVLIRILAPPEDDGDMRTPKRYKKKEAWDTRSRRSSLPTLYEYDSDGGSSVRTIRNEPLPTVSGAYQFSQRSRRPSRSSYRSDNVDMRSMSEMTVDFARPDHYDNMSDASSLYPQRYYDEEGYERRSVQRSISHPSLARSASEFTEHWVAPDHDSDVSSPDATPKSRRSQRVLTTFQQRPPPQQSLSSLRPGRMVTQTQYHESRVSTFQSKSTEQPREW